MLTSAVDEYPRGYPRLAAFLSSTPDTLLFRNFLYLRTRLLLGQQNAVQKLEEELDAVDIEDSRGCPQQREALRRSAAQEHRLVSGLQRRSRSTILEETYMAIQKYGRSCFHPSRQ